MKLVVVSDNHGLKQPIDDIRRQHLDADAFFHCGDSELPIRFLDGFAAVCGNNDYTVELPESRIVELNGLRIFVTHGHRYLLFGRVDMLLSKAIYENCQLVLFGHTHCFYHEVIEGIHFVNPGSIAHNRDGSMPSYAVITVDDSGIHVKRMER